MILLGHRTLSLRAIQRLPATPAARLPPARHQLARSYIMTTESSRSDLSILNFSSLLAPNH
jgi:hypothetical protein